MAEIIKEVSEEIGGMMKDFTVFYVRALVMDKIQGIMDESCEAVIPSGLQEIMDANNEDDGGDGDGDGGDADGGDDNNDDGGDKEAEEENPGNEEEQNKDTEKEKENENEAEKNDDKKEEDTNKEDNDKKEEENKDDNKEENNEEEEEEKEEDDSPPFVAGVVVLSYRNGIGPDSLEHRYYDCGGWLIKEKNSMIIKTVERHSNMQTLLTSLTKNQKYKPLMPKDVQFPKKKRFGRNDEYYKQRMKGIYNYFESLSKIQDISISDPFLEFFKLKINEKQEYFREIFFIALEQMCDELNINYNSAKQRAEKLGLDLNECEMLKVIAIEKVGKQSIIKLRTAVSEKSPDFLPSKVKGRFVSKAEIKLYTAIASNVELGWKVTKEAFQKIVEKLSDLLDKILEPIKKILEKAIEPIGKVIKEKFDKIQGAITLDNKANKNQLRKKITYERFPPLLKFFNDLKQLKDNNNNKESKMTALELSEVLLQSINDMNHNWKYVTFVCFNFENKIFDLLPFIQELKSSHYRLTIALTDLCYILSRASIRAFLPIIKYLDKLIKDGNNNNGFDADKHLKNLQDAVRESGRILAMDYFSLPNTLYRTTWYCGQSITKKILKLAQQTINKIADLIGSFAMKWKPKSETDIIDSFCNALIPALNKFINNRIYVWISLIRETMEDLIGNKILDLMNDTIENVTETLNDLCSNLPDPFGSHIKAGNIVKYLINKLTVNAVKLFVKKVSEEKENLLLVIDEKKYTIHSMPDPMDESLCRSLRWQPYFRSDEISFEPLADSKEEEEDNNNNNNNDDKKEDDNNNDKKEEDAKDTKNEEENNNDADTKKEENDAENKTEENKE